MRFSIRTLAFLTLWAALGISCFSALREIRKHRLQREVHRSESAMHQAVLTQASITELGIERNIPELNRYIAQHQDLADRLTLGFESRIQELSAIVVKEGLFSVREVPTIQSERRFLKTIKAFVPDSRRVAIEIEMFDDDHVTAYPPREREALLESPDLRGEHPVIVELTTGEHIISVDFDYRDTSKKSLVVAMLDGETIASFESQTLENSGYGASSGNWQQQRDFQARQNLPTIVKLSPNPGDAELRFRFVDLTDSKPVSGTNALQNSTGGADHE